GTRPSAMTGPANGPARRSGEHAWRAVDPRRARRTRLARRHSGQAGAIGVPCRWVDQVARLSASSPESDEEHDEGSAVPASDVSAAGASNSVGAGAADPRAARQDGRSVDELRPVSFERDYTVMAPGSVLVT